MALEYGLTAKVTPSFDERELDNQVDNVEEKLNSVSAIELEADTSAIEEELENLSATVDVAGGGAGGGVGGATTGRGGGGLAGSVAKGGIGASVAKKAGLSSLASGGALGALAGPAGLAVTLSGAVGIGILKAVQSASPALQGTLGMLGQAMDLFFQPFGKALSNIIRPALSGLLEFSKSWNSWANDNTQLIEHLLGLFGDIVTWDFDGVLKSVINIVDYFTGGALKKTFKDSLSFVKDAITDLDIVGGVKSAFDQWFPDVNLGDVTLGDALSFPGWGNFIPSISWSITDFNWDDFIPSISWGITDFSWGDFIPSISWGITNFSWGDFIPSIDWNLSGFGWDDFIPTIDWGIPNFPGWSDFVDGGGSDGDTNTSGGYGGSGGADPDDDGGGDSYGGSDFGRVDEGATDSDPDDDYSDYGSGSGSGGGFSPISGFADGGVVTSPTRALIGEQGPEAVVPLEQAFGGTEGFDNGGDSSMMVAREIAQGNEELLQKMDDLISAIENTGGDTEVVLDSKSLNNSLKKNEQRYTRSREVTK